MPNEIQEILGESFLYEIIKNDFYNNYEALVELHNEFYALSDVIATDLMSYNDNSSIITDSSSIELFELELEKYSPKLTTYLGEENVFLDSIKSILSNIDLSGVSYNSLELSLDLNNIDNMLELPTDILDINKNTILSSVYNTTLIYNTSSDFRIAVLLTAFDQNLKQKNTINYIKDIKLLGNILINDFSSFDNSAIEEILDTNMESIERHLFINSNNKFDVNLFFEVMEEDNDITIITENKNNIKRIKLGYNILLNNIKDQLHKRNINLTNLMFDFEQII